MAVLSTTQLLTGNYTDSSGISIGTSNYIGGQWDNPHGNLKGSSVLIENNDGSLTFIFWHDDYTGDSGDGGVYYDHYQFCFYVMNGGTIDSSYDPGKQQLIAFSNTGTPPSYFSTSKNGIDTWFISNWGINAGNSGFGNIYSDLVSIAGHPCYRARLHPTGGPGRIIYLSNISHFVNGHQRNGTLNDGQWNGPLNLILKYVQPVFPTLTSVTPAAPYQGDSAVLKGTNFQDDYVVYFTPTGGTATALQYTYIDSQTVNIITPTQFIGGGLLSMNNGKQSSSNTLPFTILQPSTTVLYSGPSNEVSASFGQPPLNLAPGILTINGPDSIVESRSGTYGALYLAPGSTQAIDVSTQCTWTSTRAATFYSSDGIYHASLPAGPDVITATYYPYIASPPTVPTLQSPNTVIASATKNVSVVDDRFGVLRIVADQNPVRSDSSTSIHVYITNPGQSEIEITPSATIASTIPNTVNAGTYSNPGAQQTGTLDLLTATSIDANGNLLTATLVMQTIVIYPKVLTLIPANPSVQVGTTQQFTTKLFDPNTNTVTHPAATWTVQNVSAAGTINGSGLFLGTGIGPQAIVNAVATDGSRTSASTSVAVTAQVPLSNPAPTLVISPVNPTIQVNDSLQFTVTKTDYLGTVSHPVCEWSVSNIDGIGAVTQNGVFTALRPGSNVQITATTDDSDAASISTTIHINPLPSVSRLSVVPSSAIVLSGTTQQFSVIATNTNGEIVDPAISWSVQSVNGTGIIDADSGLFIGEIAGTEVIVTATGPVQPNGTQPRATATVVVTAGHAIRIVVTPTNVQILNGQGQQFQAIGYDEFNNAVSLTNPSPTWALIGGMGSVTQGGLFSSTHEGVGRVIATQGTVSGSAQVNVLRTVGGVVVTNDPQQPFAKINIKNPLKAPTIIDTRVRGGGIKDRNALPQTDDFWWDISRYDGQPFHPFGVYVVKAVPPIGSSVNAADISPGRITETLSKYAAPHFFPLIMPPGV